MTSHEPVLQQEIIEMLKVNAADVVCDMTVGSGGHAAALCQKIENGRLIGIDADQDAVATARARLEEKCSCRVSVINGNFRNIDALLNARDIDTIDKALFDLGMRTQQLEESGRGFTFQKDEPLLMTFQKRPREEDLTAWEIVNQWDRDHIVDILEGYADERYAKRIADAIEEERTYEGNIDTTGDLKRVIKEAVPDAYENGRIHPATRTFQALRITVNDEIEALKDGLKKTFDRLSQNGRMAVISFHSIEDRTVKQFIKRKADAGALQEIGEQPMQATEEEINKNPRSRSAKLRVCEKTNE